MAFAEARFVSAKAAYDRAKADFARTKAAAAPPDHAISESDAELEDAVKADFHLTRARFRDLTGVRFPSLRFIQAEPVPPRPAPRPTVVSVYPPGLT